MNLVFQSIGVKGRGQVFLFVHMFFVSIQSQSKNQGESPCFDHQQSAEGQPSHPSTAANAFHYLQLPSSKLTYPPKNGHFETMIFRLSLSVGICFLVPWRLPRCGQSRCLLLPHLSSSTGWLFHNFRLFSRQESNPAFTPKILNLWMLMYIHIIYIYIYTVYRNTCCVYIYNI